LVAGVWRLWVLAPPWLAADRLQRVTPLVLALCAAAIHIGLYQASELAMNYAGRFSWQILFPVALVALAVPLNSRTFPWSLAACALTVGVELSFDWQPWLAGAAALAAMVLLAPRWRQGAALAMGVVAVLVVSDTSPRELTATAAYRYRLEYAHEALGNAVAADRDFRGTVAIGDAGIMPYCLGGTREVYDLRGLADPYLRRGPLPARLTERQVQMVVAVGRPYDPKGWRATTPTSLPLLKYAYAEGFTPAARLRFTETAWQTVLVRPGRPVPALAEQARRAHRENLRPDAQVVRDHMGELPFLSTC
ncbi:hypothetical protein P8605_45245, partial [Streptomyces sp. T-3]|nr:hypothetical protein [Streptomyces sp. T-3]